MSSLSGSYNAVTWLLDRNVDEGPGQQTRLYRYRLRIDLWRFAKAKLPRRQHAAPPRRPPRRAGRHDHARHGRFPDRVSRRDPRRCGAGAAQHALDLGSIRLCAGGLPRPGAVHFRSAAAGGQGRGRADAGSRSRRGFGQRRRTATRNCPTSWPARAIRLQPPRPTPTSRRSGCILRVRPACPRACGICIPIWPRRRTPTPNRCSAFARTMSGCRRRNCFSPMASATR